MEKIRDFLCESILDCSSVMNNLILFDDLSSVWYNLLNKTYNSRIYSNRGYTDRTFGQKIIGCLVVNKKVLLNH